MRYCVACGQLTLLLNQEGVCSARCYHWGRGEVVFTGEEADAPIRVSIRTLGERHLAVETTLAHTLHPASCPQRGKGNR